MYSSKGNEVRQERKRNMLNLVLKDFRILKHYWWNAPIYGFCGLFAFSLVLGDSTLTATTVGATYMLMERACDLDARNNSEIIINSLPVHRRDIVLAKYLSVFPYAALAILSFILAQVVVSVTGIPILGVTGPLSNLSLEKFMGAVVAVIVLISFYYPIYFKLGHRRSKWAGMILFFCLVFFIPLSGYLLAGEYGVVRNPILLNIIDLLGRLGSWQQTQADWQIASYMFVLAMILMSASVRLSLRFYRNKEF